MKSMRLVLAFGLLIVLTLAGTSGAADLGLITGGERGTYYQFGLNLQTLVKAHGIDLAVHTSRGSVENIYAVYQKPGVQMGIVQADVLAFVSRIQTDPILKRIASKTKMVFPLYNEEIHILGRREITDFDGLADRRVAIGREGSGTYLTARLLFKTSEVAPKEMVPIDTDEALAELKAGRIDAMFYVAGYPVKLLSEKVAAADGLALIPITNKSILEFYPAAEIPTGTYTWQEAAVQTAAVKAVLVSSTSDRETVTSSAASPRPSRAIPSGSRRMAIQSGKRSTSTSRSRAGTNTTAWRSTCGGPAGPPRCRRRRRRRTRCSTP